MGCNCYDEKKQNSSDNNLNNKVIINRALTNTKINNNKVQNEEESDKISSFSSINPDNSINTVKKSDSLKKNKNQGKTNIIPKFNIESFEDFNLKNSIPLSPSIYIDSKIKDNKNENMNPNREYICNISKINYNHKEKEKYKFKQNEIEPIKKLINTIKNRKEYKEKNKNIFLFYKGNRLHDNDTIYNIINKKNSQLDNIFNNNIINKQKETNEIDFDMISFSIDEEENINDNSINKKESNSFSSDESYEKKIEKKKEKIKIKTYDKEISKKMMYRLSPICKNHNQENLMYICLNCFNSFCPLDFKEHKKEYREHEVIPKIRLIELNCDIKKIKENLSDKYKEIIPDLANGNQAKNLFENNENENNKLNYISSNELFSKLKIEINNINEEMESLYNSYKQSYNKMNLKFLSIYEDKMPKIIEFDEYIDKTLREFENLNIFSNENIFADNYNNCLNIKKVYNKYYQSIISLKDIIIKYKEILELFKEKGKELNDYIRTGINNIMKFKNGEQIFNLTGAFLQLNEKTDIINENNNNINNIIINNKNDNIKSSNNISIVTNKAFNQTINLRFLFSEKKNKISKSFMNRNAYNNMNISNGCSSIIKNKKHNIKIKDKISIMSEEKINNKNNVIDNNEIIPKFEKEIKPNDIILQSPSNVSSKGIFKFEINSPIKLSSNSTNKSNELIQNNLFALIYGTKNIIKYNSKTKQLNILSPDISILKIQKFEDYISFLNFKNKFYISGGYSTSKQFYEYDIDSNNFKKLPEMLSNHYYHTMIGNNNYIYSVSGFKSKKVEKYDIMNKQWKSLPDLSYERTYSNTLVYNNNIFIFGKINDFNDEQNSNNIIEYYNIENENENGNKWNQIAINIKFPFNSGIIKNNSNTILLVGGKMELNENSIDSCYCFNIKKMNNNYNIDIKLSKIKLESPDEFNGNNFCCLDENLIEYGLFSSINQNLLCLYNKNTNKFKYMKLDNSE